MIKIKNTDETSTEEILSQMKEPRPLPMGRKEFDDWAERIMSGALCPAEPASQRYALCEMILHLGPTESHKPDAYFIHCLRKAAVNEVAVAVKAELLDEKEKKMLATMTDEEKEAFAAAKKRLHKVGSFG